MYHVTDQGPKVCKSTMGLCPYAKGQNNHFENQAEAYQEFENRLTKQYGTLGTTVARRVNKSPLQKKYRTLDKLEKTSSAYKAISNRQKLRSYTPTRRNMRNSRPSVRGGQSGPNRARSRSRSLPSRMLRKQTRKFARAITPNARSVKKMLLVKYWMPDIHSNKWR